MAEILTKDEIARIVHRIADPAIYGTSNATLLLHDAALRTALDAAARDRDFNADSLEAATKNGRIQWERAARAEADLAAARARVEELEREAVIDLHSTNAIRDDLAAANECIERQNANVRRLEADLAAMTERATKAEVELMDHLVGTEGVRRAIVRTQEQTRKAEDARDAALSRCSELEAQRDEARRMYCSTERALRYEQGEKFSEHDIAGEEWPAEADRLFPPEKGGE
jgi:chromosome segregation ATPase